MKQVLTCVFIATETLFDGVVGLSSREFTSLDVAAAVRELNDTILNSILNNVYQLDAKTIMLKLHKPNKPTYNLVLEAGKRINLTTYASEKPQRPPAFCMALRKFLRNARLSKVEQHEFERVVVISFQTHEDCLQLVLEFFGDGNVVLLNEEGIILQAMTYKRMRDRNILRGETFKFAPSAGKNPSRTSDRDFAVELRTLGNAQIVRAITRTLSIGGTLAEEVLARAGIEKTRTATELSNEEIDTMLRVLQEIILQVNSGALEPHVVLDGNDHLVDVAPLKLKRYDNPLYKTQTYGTFNEALDEFYSKLCALDKAAKQADTNEFEAETSKLQRIIDEQKKTIGYADAEADRLKRIGDLIYAHFNDLQVLRDKFLDEKKHERQRQEIAIKVLDEKRRGLMPSMLFDSFVDNKVTIKVNIEGETFNLSLQKTLFDIAAEFYERGKIARQKAEGARTAMREHLVKLGEVQTKIREAKEVELTNPAKLSLELEKRRIRQKEWFEKFRWFTSSEGLLIVAGKDAITNEVLIKKYTEPYDVVFHADIVGAPFVVIKTKGNVPGRESLIEAGEFAAAFSRGWREGFASVDVYWVKPEQLSKGGPSGESVGHGAFVVRGERNWMRGTPLRVAIGIVLDGGAIKILGGPIGAVKAKTSVFVVIVPGDLKTSELSRLIVKMLNEKAPRDMRQEVLDLQLEGFGEFVPYSKASLLKE
jgi:predicted ribosome quality control (RQC) complex YloA/Tae2 family protein